MNETVAREIEVTAPMVLFGFLFLAVVLASIVAWLWFLLNRRIIQSWSGWMKDSPATTIGLIDLIGCCACIVLAQVLTMNVARLLAPFDLSGPSQTEIAAGAAVPAEAETWRTPIVTLSLVLGGLLSVGLVMLRTGIPASRLGFPMHQAARDILIGLVGFLLVTPVVLVLSQVAVRLTDVEYEHPVIDAMRENPLTFPFLFLGAVIGAPLWEEFAFRGLLIGWLNSIRWSRGNLRTILLGRRESPQHGPDSPTDPSGESASALQPIDSNALSSNPYVPLNEPRESAGQARIDGASAAGERYPPWWPAIVSGIAFGLAHFGYGVSWMPLVLFGIVLGRLAQLRQSIVPGLVIHACFNALSMIGLAIQVSSGRG